MDNTFEVVNVDEEAQVITLTKSPPKSLNGKKRKYEDLTTEQDDVQIIDLSQDNGEQQPEPVPKKPKLDANISTLNALSQSTDFSDITFQVGDKQFFGLKAIFAIKSEAFRNMLYPNEQPQEIRYIEITDISAEAFKFIRDYFYDLNPEVTFENVVNVLNASKNYAIESITNQCIEFLNQIDNVNDLLSVLSQFGRNNGLWSLNTELNELVNSQKIINLLQNDGKQLIESEIFGSLPFEIAKILIQSDDLGVSEDSLWNNTKHWLSTNGNELKQIIRFCNMDTEFVFNEIKNYEILNDNDLCSIYELKLGLNNNAQSLFNCNPRFETKPKSKRGGRSPRKSFGGRAPKKSAKTEMEVEENNNDTQNVEEAAQEQKEEKGEAKPVTPSKTRSRSRKKKTTAKGSRSRSKSTKRKKKN